MSSLYVDTIRNRDGNGAPVFDKGIVISGIITASGSLAGDSVSIGVTEVVSSSFELKNITGIDSTTTASIEAAIANAPNDFTSLNVSGISTFGDDIDLNADIDIFGHTEINTLNASGILTASTLTTGAESSAIRISSNTISGPATITIDPAGIGTNTGTVVIQGDLQVDGDTTTVNSTNLTVDDKNIILASGSLTDASSDGGGITLESGEGNKTINWVNSTDSWTFSENIDLAASKTFKIEGTDVLSSTAVGSAVTNSSLQNVGTLAGVQVSGAATFSGSATFGGDLDIDGHTDLDNVNIAGVTTFASNIDADGNLDVDGITDLDVLRVAETATFSSNIDANGNLDVDGHTDLDNVNIAGVTTFASNIDADGDLDVDGHTNLDNVNVSGAITATTFTGNLDGTVNTATQSNITSLGTLTGLNVSGQTDLNNVNVSGVATVGLTTVLETGILAHDLNVSGVSTFNGDIRLTEQDGSGIYFGAGLDFAIAHDGSNSYLFERGGTGNVYLAGSNEVIIADASGSGPNPSDYVTETKARFVTNGPVRLYYDNVEKFATAGSGATVYGTFTADTLSVSGISTFTGDIDVDGHTNLDNVNVSGAITATTFTGNLDGTVSTAAQANITSLGTLTGLTVSGNITAQADLDVDGHTNLDNVSIAGVTTFTGAITANSLATINSDLDVTQQLDVQGTSELTHVNVDGFTTVTGGTSLANVSISGVTTFTDFLDVNNASIDVAGNLNALTFRAGLSTFTGFVYNELDTSTDLRNAGDFNSITGVAFTAGGTDTLYWDFATAPSVIGGEASNGITNIELASLPTNREYMVRATLITWTDDANDWDTGNVVLKVNGQTPTNYLWRNGAQPVGTTTGAANHFDIVEFKIVHDTNDEFSVFAEWSAYHDPT